MLGTGWESAGNSATAPERQISGALRICFEASRVRRGGPARRPARPSALLVGAIVGALVAGRVADLIGRRFTVLITAAIFVVGVLLAAFTRTYPVLLVARVVIGLAVGSASMVVPLYIGGVVPPRVRGGLVSLNQLAITGGILVSCLIDYGLSGSGNWRLMFGLAAIPAVLLSAGMLFQKESPAWLIRQDRIDEARAVLTRLRDSDDIDAEIHDVQEVSRKEAGTRELFLFGFLTLVALAYFWRKVPETRGRSLQEIERDLTGTTDISASEA